MGLKHTPASVRPGEEYGVSVGAGFLTVPDRYSVGSVQPTSQHQHFSIIKAPKSLEVTKIGAITGGTAAGATPTTLLGGLYSFIDGELSLLEKSANTTAAFNTTNALHELALEEPVFVKRGSFVAASFLIVSGTTTPSLLTTNNSTQPLVPLFTLAPLASCVLTGRTSLVATHTPTVAVGSSIIFYIS